MITRDLDRGENETSSLAESGMIRTKGQRTVWKVRSEAAPPIEVPSRSTGSVIGGSIGIPLQVCRGHGLPRWRCPDLGLLVDRNTRLQDL